ncbi:Two-component system protein A [Pleurostoma richardsiae]|uniref:Two-component system protein A n=1 Tax=Pleurostoma richardsiae TaxID=41990 RepID=A0AA38VEV0_9PEZI|nr:Two-component system protein A [Pleurostoma richardsiae]
MDSLPSPTPLPTRHPESHSDVPDLDELYDLSPISTVILSPDRRIARVSSRFLRAWEITLEQCLGQHLRLFLSHKAYPARAADPDIIEKAIDEAIAVRSEYTSRPIFISLRGVPTKWTSRVIPIFKEDVLVALFLEWQQTPTSLGEGELAQTGLSTDEAFRILVQAVKDYAIFLLDTNGNIATWNSGAELHKGYTKEEIIGKHFSIFYGKEDLEAEKPKMELEICLREGRVEDEGWRYRKDGSRFWANVIITAVYKDGVHVGFGKVTRDLTERKAAESRLIAAYEESEKLKSDFLANMSHEIRTPMHGMLSACALLLDMPLAESQRDLANLIHESGDVLLQVINDILDYSKLASGTFSINSDVVGIASIITSVVRSAQTTLPPAVHFELFLSPDLPKSVQGDPLRYRQILQNIISNAVKFTEGGYIRVRALVQHESEDSYMVFTEVVDTGIGIPEPAATSLFTPFMQFDNTTRKRYKGTGLGLSIAKSLIELMGGLIGYRPNPERQGSVFWFTANFKKITDLVQVHTWEGDLTSRQLVPQQPVGMKDTADPRTMLEEVAPTTSLLVVEDNIINQKVILGILRSAGFKNVDLASNGAEAVSMVRAKPASYDAVLMDINMPIVDGYDATSQIRDSGIRVPIIAMTAYALKGDRERCLERGMDDYVPKPIDKMHLMRVLVKWLVQVKDYRAGFRDQRDEAVEISLSHPVPSAREASDPSYENGRDRSLSSHLPSSPQAVNTLSYQLSQLPGPHDLAAGVDDGLDKVSLEDMKP